MILLWGLEHDTPLARVREWLMEWGIEHLFLNQADILETQIDIRYSGQLRGAIQAYGERHSLEDFRSLYLRPYDFREFAHMHALAETGPEWAHAMDFEDALWAYADITAAFVINRPSTMLSNNSKPVQAELIRRSGFSVPTTLITTEPAAAIAFWRRHGQVIYKSLSGQRSIVAKLSEADCPRLENVRWCPTQFQQFVEGDEYRVHVVGCRTFATKITSQSTDYRYGTAAYEAADIPAEIAIRCIQLSRSLDLPLSGIDLRRDPHGEWYCFEVNPSPAYSCYESEPGHQISRAIAELMVSVLPGHGNM